MANKPGFQLKDVPNAILNVFGVRTEAEVPYRLSMKDGSFEVRVVDTHVELVSNRKGVRLEAARLAFDDLFAYIKGHNKRNVEFPMTAPVWEVQTSKGWATSFFLRGNRADLPAPLDRSLKLITHAEERVAIIRFTGMAKDLNVQEATDRLTVWMSDHQLEPIGEPRLAQFDPPFAIPFMRRNEVQIKIRPVTH